MATTPKLAPFFRIPGLMRAEGVEDYLASKGIQVWSADFPADDWRHISSSRVYELAIKRLEDKGKGILLLHDIQARTVAALPRILNELKARGYRIVHVVPATPENPATPTEPQDWLMHPAQENVAIRHWPRIPNFASAEPVTLPALALSDLDWAGEQAMTLLESDRSIPHGLSMRRGIPWPLPSSPPPHNTATALPIPAQGVFDIPEGLRVVMRADAPPARHAEPVIAEREEAPPSRAGGGKRNGRGKRLAGQVGHAARSRQATGHAAGRPAAQAAHRGAPKHVAQIRKRRA